MSSPLISIVMASYNHCDYISEAIESVLNQSYPSWELFIVDDASTDNTPQVLEKYEDHPQIHIHLSETNRKIHSRNFAAERAKGKYLAFLNSDDVFLPGKLKQQVEYLEAHAECGAVFSHVEIINSKGRHLPGHKLEQRFAVGNQDRHEWLSLFYEQGNHLCISSAVISTEVFNTVGRFNPLMVQLADLDLWARICFAAQIHILQEKLTRMRVTGSNLSNSSPATLSRDAIETEYRLDPYFLPENAQQLALIFPQLGNLLSTNFPEWNTYVLCRRTLLKKSEVKRRVGARHLHRLLENEEVRLRLEKKHVRLMKSFLTAEGGAALNSYAMQQQWTLRNDGETIVEAWFGQSESNTLNIIFQMDEKPGCLSLKLKGNHLTDSYTIRLYEMESGRLILDHVASVVFLGRTPINLPEVEFGSGPGGRLEMEIIGKANHANSMKSKVISFLSKQRRSIIKRLP